METLDQYLIQPAIWLVNHGNIQSMVIFVKATVWYVKKCYLEYQQNLRSFYCRKLTENGGKYVLLLCPLYKIAMVLQVIQRILLVRWIDNWLIYMQINYNFFVDVCFEVAVKPVRLDIYEVYNPGSVVRIWGSIDGKKFIHLWSGTPSNLPAESRIFSPPIKQLEQPVK